VTPHTLIIGCGYLGLRAGERLARRGELVAGTVRTAAGAARLVDRGVTPVLVDVLDPDSLAALPSADRVLYCVGFDRSAGVPMRSVYVDGLRRVLERLGGRVGRLVYASSTGVYGQVDGYWIDEEAPTVPGHESGRIVLEAEDLARDLASRQGVPLVILRFAGLYGPGRLPRRASLIGGEPIVGDPDRPLNLVHIDDAATAAIAALDRGVGGRTYHVADDRPLPRRDYYSLAARLMGAPEPRFVPPRPGSPESAREASSKRISNQRMRAELGVSLAYPDITTGVPAAIGLDD
jgi:nucleoside-diphosphate-sugar epimerase